MLANTFDAHGAEYVWLPSNSPGIFAHTIDSPPDSSKSRGSSPLSPLPVDMDIEPQHEQLKPLTDEPGNRKRKRETSGGCRGRHGSKGPPVRGAGWTKVET
jgi:hypothetical protein